MRYILLLSLLFFSLFASAQNKADQWNSHIVNIKGTAPAYVGKDIEVYRIEDYLSFKETRIASATVQPDSSFSLNFNAEDIEKVIVRSANNRGILYVEPGAKYDVFYPERNKYEPYKPSGNYLEVGFYDLDSTDINYKILGFQRWLDEFMGNAYYASAHKSDMSFIEALDAFKSNVESVYKKDTSLNSSYLKTYIKFSLAGIDNINNAAQRNQYEKHDFYIKYSPVAYKNDVYMDYIKGFYTQTIPRLSNKANDEYYQGIIRSSPTLLMKALGKEYTLINMRIREIVLIQSLSEIYYSSDYPQTNVITILDSLSNRCVFPENVVIAKNIRERLLSISPGSKAPDFVLSSNDSDTKTLVGLRGKHVYLHFFDPTSNNSIKELPLVEELNNKYGKYVTIISIYKNDLVLEKEHQEFLDKAMWAVYPISPSNSIWTRYQIQSYPHYVFIDATGYLISSPALGPTPNGDYETIDRTFFELKKVWERENAEDGDLYNRND